MSALWTTLRQAVIDGVGADELVEAHREVAVRARAGQRLYDEGDPADVVYLLVDGEVCTSISAGPEGERRTTAWLKAPALLADREAVASSDCLETARCVSPSVFLGWSTERFTSELAKSAVLAAVMCRDLAARHRCALAHLRLSAAPVSLRVAAALLERPLAAGPAAASALAELAATSEKSVGKALTELRRRRLFQPPPREWALSAEAASELGLAPPLHLYHRIDRQACADAERSSSQRE